MTGDGVKVRGDMSELIESYTVQLAYASREHDLNGDQFRRRCCDASAGARNEHSCVKMKSEEIAAFRKAAGRDSSSELRALLSQQYDISVKIREETGLTVSHLSALKNDYLLLQALGEHVQQRVSQAITATTSSLAAAAAALESQHALVVPTTWTASTVGATEEAETSLAAVESANAEVLARASDFEAKEGHTRSVRYPLQPPGPNTSLSHWLDLRDSSGRTALHTAVHANSMQATRCLLQLGASLTARCHHGFLPVHYARSRAMIQLLMCGVGGLPGVQRQQPQASGKAQVEDGQPAWPFNAGNFPQPSHRECFSGCARERLVHVPAAGKKTESAIDTCSPRQLPDRPLLIPPMQDPSHPVQEALQPGWKLLHFAAASADQASLTTWSKSGALQPDARGPGGLTALHVLCTAGDSEAAAACAKVLIQAGADPTAADDVGRSPVHWACMTANVGVLDTLLGAMQCTQEGAPGQGMGQDFEVLERQFQQAALESEDKSGYTPLHLASLYGHVQPISRIAAAGCDMNPLLPKDGATPLHLAAGAGHARAVQELLARGARPMAVDKSGRTALHDAATCGHLLTLQVMVQHMLRGCERVGKEQERLKVAFGPDKRGRTPMHDAAGNGHEAAALYMLSALCSCTVGTGNTGESQAAMDTTSVCTVTGLSKAQALTVVQALKREDIRAVSDALHSRAVQGRSTTRSSSDLGQPQAAQLHPLAVWTPLVQGEVQQDATKLQMYPLPHGSPNIVLPCPPTAAQGVYLGHRNLADLPMPLSSVLATLGNSADSEGWTIAHEAAAGGCPALLHMLMCLGVPLYSARPLDGHTLAHTAAVFGRPSVLALLRDMGLDLGLGDANGDTPMHWAAFKNNAECVRLLVKAWSEKTVPRGMSRSAHANAGPSGPPLSSQGLFHSLGAARAAGWGVFLCAKNSDGGVPLHSAANSGCLSAGKLLLGSGVQPSLSMADGNSALHNAAYEGHADFARLLLEYGASPDVANEEKRCPLHEAAANGHARVITVMLQGVPLLDMNEEGIRDRAPSTESHAASDVIPTDLTLVSPVSRANGGVFSRLLNSAASAIGRGSRGSSRHGAGDSPGPSSSSDVRGSPRAAHPSSTAQESTKVIVRANPNVQDSGGDTPLHWSVCNNSPCSARALLEGGADPSIRNIDGGNPIHAAIINNSSAGLKVLLEYGGDPNSRFSPVDGSRSSRDTALHVAAAEGRVDCLKLLLMAGARVDEANARKRTALHDAVRSRQVECVEALLQAGADISPLDDTERTPFGVAVPRIRLPALVMSKADEGAASANGSGHRQVAVGPRGRSTGTPSLVVASLDPDSLSAAWTTLLTTSRAQHGAVTAASPAYPKRASTTAISSSLDSARCLTGLELSAACKAVPGLLEVAAIGCTQTVGSGNASPLANPGLTTLVVHAISPLFFPLHVAAICPFTAGRWRAYNSVPHAVARRLYDAVCTLATATMNSSVQGSPDSSLERLVPAAALHEPPSVALNPLLSHMAELLSSGTFTDTTLRAADGTEIQAHRVVLASRVEPLLALYASGWAESAASVVQVSMQAEVLIPLLVWAYTGRLPPVSVTVGLALLELADAWAQDELLQTSLGACVRALRLEDLMLAFEWASERHAAGRLWAWELMMACVDFFVTPSTALAIVQHAKEQQRSAEQEYARAISQWRDAAIAASSQMGANQGLTSAFSVSSAVSSPCAAEAHNGTDMFSNATTSAWRSHAADTPGMLGSGTQGSFPVRRSARGQEESGRGPIALAAPAFTALGSRGHMAASSASSTGGLAHWLPAPGHTAHRPPSRHRASFGSVSSNESEGKEEAHDDNDEGHVAVVASRGRQQRRTRSSFALGSSPSGSVRSESVSSVSSRTSQRSAHEVVGAASGMGTPTHSTTVAPSTTASVPHTTDATARPGARLLQPLSGSTDVDSDAEVVESVAALGALTISVSTPAAPAPSRGVSSPRRSGPAGSRASVGSSSRGLRPPLASAEAENLALTMAARGADVSAESLSAETGLPAYLVQRMREHGRVRMEQTSAGPMSPLFTTSARIPAAPAVMVMPSPLLDTEEDGEDDEGKREAGGSTVARVSRSTATSTMRKGGRPTAKELMPRKGSKVSLDLGAVTAQLDVADALEGSAMDNGSGEDDMDLLPPPPAAPVLDHAMERYSSLVCFILQTDFTAERERQKANNCLGVPNAPPSVSSTRSPAAVPPAAAPAVGRA